LRAEGSGSARHAAVSFAANWLPCPDVGLIWQQKTGFAIVSQIRVQDLVADAFPQHYVPHRNQNFDSLVKIAGHPVRASDINFLFAAIGKIINAAVFEESSDNAAHPDILAHPPHSRTQRADSTNNQIDLHPRLRSPVQRLHNVFVQQSVHFGDDARWISAARVLGFALNQR